MLIALLACKSKSSVTGSVSFNADCTGGGHVVRASFDFAGCGQYGFGP